MIMPVNALAVFIILWPKTIQYDKLVLDVWLLRLCVCVEKDEVVDGTDCVCRKEMVKGSRKKERVVVLREGGNVLGRSREGKEGR